MPLITALPGWTRPGLDAEARIRTYSAVGDVLAYQRCRRQYGYFHVRGYDAPSATQQYFGTLVHDVLDQVYRAYTLAGALPDEPEVVLAVDRAHDRLVRSGVRAQNAPQQRRRAAKLIHRFIELFGTAFFDNVTETEVRLSRALETEAQHIPYVLEGVVDVLSGAVSHALRLPYSTEPDDVEIWDYKSGRLPDTGSRERQAYTYQMRVYTELYRQQTGVYPARAVLVFLGELDDDATWTAAAGDAGRFPGLVYPVDPHPGRIATAVSDFSATVEAIEAERSLPYAQQWQAPTHDVDPQTCRACELRYNCAAYPAGAAERRVAP